MPPPETVRPTPSDRPDFVPPEGARANLVFLLPDNQGIADITETQLQVLQFTKLPSATDALLAITVAHQIYGERTPVPEALGNLRADLDSLRPKLAEKRWEIVNAPGEQIGEEDIAWGQEPLFLRALSESEDEQAPHARKERPNPVSLFKKAQQQLSAIEAYLAVPNLPSDEREQYEALAAQLHSGLEKIASLLPRAAEPAEASSLLANDVIALPFSEANAASPIISEDVVIPRTWQSRRRFDEEDEEPEDQEKRESFGFIDDDSEAVSLRDLERLSIDTVLSQPSVYDDYDHDIMRVYMVEAGRRPLLTSEQEVALAKQMEEQLTRKEDAQRRVGAAKALGNSDQGAETQLREADYLYHEARRTFAESNLRLVMSVASKYIGRGMSLLDLIQEGNIGLLRGVEKYDWRKGFRFSTYAYWWIRQAVTRAIADQARTIRLPVHIIEQLTHLGSAAIELQQELGREPTPAEIGQRLGIEPEKVREKFRAAKLPISLETPIGQEGVSILVDMIADMSVKKPAEAAEDEDLKRMLDDALRRHLTPREAYVLRLRFGLEDGKPRTLGEVGDELGFSRERARQIGDEAIIKLRKSTAFMERFREFIE